MEEKQDTLCIKILQTLREMMAVDPEYGDKGDSLRVSLLIRYFSKFPLPPMQVGPSANNLLTSSSPNPSAPKMAALNPGGGPDVKFIMRAQLTLHDVQCHLDDQGASALLVDLVIKSEFIPKIFAEVGRHFELVLLFALPVCTPQVVELGIAILEGGNFETQKSLHKELESGDRSQDFFRVFFDKISEAQSEIKSTVTVNTADIAARANDDKDPAKELERVIRKRGGWLSSVLMGHQFKFISLLPWGSHRHRTPILLDVFPLFGSKPQLSPVL